MKPTPIKSVMKKLDDQYKTDRLTELIGNDEKNMEGIMRLSSF